MVLFCDLALVHLNGNKNNVEVIKIKGQIKELIDSKKPGLPIYKECTVQVKKSSLPVFTFCWLPLVVVSLKVESFDSCARERKCRFCKLTVCC